MEESKAIKGGTSKDDMDVHSKDSDLHSRANLGAVHGSEDSEAGTHQGSSNSGVHLLRDREGEVFMRANMT